MTGAFALAGWHFSRNPTSSSSENPVAKAVDSEPWKTGSDARYQYHPGGDPSRGRKDAPSALNEVIIPNVNLPKVCTKRCDRKREDVEADWTLGASREVQQVGKGGLLNMSKDRGTAPQQQLEVACHVEDDCAIESASKGPRYTTIPFVPCD